MIYVRFFGGNGYCGCDYEEYHAYDNDDVTEAELEQIAIDMAYENAEQYEYVVTGWQEDWESEEDRESYYELVKEMLLQAEVYVCERNNGK